MFRSAYWGVALLTATICPLMASGCQKTAIPDIQKNNLRQIGMAFSNAAAPAQSAGEASPKGGEVMFARPADEPADPARPARKIIYRATVELVVENFDSVPDKVTELARRFDGYVADSTFSGSAGDSRQATWKIRVPVARFDEFLQAAKNLGELKGASTRSQDVSEEYYDVEARIRNKTKEEERLLKLLEERPGKLEDVIAIERELSRVREELERMQGRMQVLADLTSLTTVEISVREIHGYQPLEAPTLARRVQRAFVGSLEAIEALLEGCLLALVAASPWLVLMLAPLVAGFGIVRRRRRLGREW